MNKGQTSVRLSSLAAFHFARSSSGLPTASSTTPRTYTCHKPRVPNVTPRDLRRYRPLLLGQGPFRPPIQQVDHGRLSRELETRHAHTELSPVCTRSHKLEQGSRPEKLNTRPAKQTALLYSVLQCRRTSCGFCQSQSGRTGSTSTTLLPLHTANMDSVTAIKHEFSCCGQGNSFFARLSVAAASQRTFRFKKAETVNLFWMLLAKSNF